MKERLHQAERAQLSFAAAASHELRTPLHQITAAATLLRSTLQPALGRDADDTSLHSARSVSPPGSSRRPSTQERRVSDSSIGSHPVGPVSRSGSVDSDVPLRPALRSISSEDRIDALQQLDIIETNGLALGTILENLIDTLDIGRLTSKLESKVSSLDSVVSPQTVGPGSANAGAAPSLFAPPSGIASNVPVLAHREAVPAFDAVLEDVVLNSVRMEERLRRVQGKGASMDGIEIVLEVLPRSRGTWKMAQEPGPLSRWVPHPRLAAMRACLCTASG